jgi:hypothetical protein
VKGYLRTSFEIRVDQLAWLDREFPQVKLLARYSDSVHVLLMYSLAVQRLVPSVAAEP